MLSVRGVSRRAHVGGHQGQVAPDLVLDTLGSNPRRPAHNPMKITEQKNAAPIPLGDILPGAFFLYHSVGEEVLAVALPLSTDSTARNRPLRNVNSDEILWRDKTDEVQPVTITAITFRRS